jgi:hypothetical protein
MRGPSINDQEDRAFGADEQPFDKLDKDTRVHAACFLDHKPHAAVRGDRRNQAHGVTNTTPTFPCPVTRYVPSGGVFASNAIPSGPTTTSMLVIIGASSAGESKSCG